MPLQVVQLLAETCWWNDPGGGVVRAGMNCRRGNNMVVHENGYLDHPADGHLWWQDGCFHVSGTTVKDKPVSTLVTLIVTILHDERELVKELVGVHVLRRWLSSLASSDSGYELERDWKCFHLGILEHGLWIHPEGEFVHITQRKALEGVVLKTRPPEPGKCLLIAPLCLHLWVE